MHPISAVYSGDSDFVATLSAPLNERIATESYGTATVLTSSKQFSSVGQPVTLTAVIKTTVRVVGTPTGSVTFMDGPTSLGTLPVRGGKVKLTTSTLPLGADPIEVIYSGDQHFAGNQSPVVVEIIGQSLTKTSATSSRKSSAFGQAVTFTAKVGTTGKAKTVPTGSVTFLDGSTLLGTVELSDGKASLRTSLLSVGSHNIRVVYNGGVGFAPSSALVRQTIKRAKYSIPRVSGNSDTHKLP